MSINTVVSLNEIVNKVLLKLKIKQEPANKNFQNYTSSELFNENSQNCASLNDAKPIDVFVPSNNIKNVELEIK
ncbi:hypothetical protein RhiirA1_478330 [Rhizophagus irregularis]|uniref:Uncharacterized protein n=2 Tax=Rhizophagus irregularis TaxID=588596 RepID=A0A2N0QS84_9GLOM|nr:hypothetical protein RhiirA1_478330 [Rhizophagus irregularis]PKK65283.1 hypothetical protein RhiirC2_786385 [Rhizophagus irregularis]GBC39784.1 hypothetical protein GLOIN_2v1497258 [Rhizophagus irregularis DAOM 181602=DAOM 197198]CAG8724184.1 1520_t:CDS:2 [Rhizophagus irregularis]